VRISDLEREDLPHTVRGYALTDVLGTGAMGRVFRARREGAEGFVRENAVKVLIDDIDVETRRKLFAREARVGSVLDHRNLVRTEDYFIEGEERFLVLELVQGSTLTALIRGRDGPLDPPEAAELVAQVCDGLHHAHNACDREGKLLGLVHRDLKPDNIMVRSDGVVKVADFGIAKPTQATIATAVTRIDTTRGTIPYMSPEQLRGDDLDRRSDVWAIGCVLYYSLTGRHLFFARTAPPLMMMIAKLDFHGRDPWSELEDILPGAGLVLRRCVCLDRTERFADASQVGATLRSLCRPPTQGSLAGISSSNLPGWMGDDEFDVDQYEVPATVEARPVRPPEPPTPLRPTPTPAEADESWIDDEDDDEPFAARRLARWMLASGLLMATVGLVAALGVAGLVLTAESDEPPAYRRGGGLVVLSPPTTAAGATRGHVQGAATAGAERSWVGPEVPSFVELTMGRAELDLLKRQDGGWLASYRTPAGLPGCAPEQLQGCPAGQRLYDKDGVVAWTKDR
jgi:serine/threonine protein kinase